MQFDTADVAAFVSSEQFEVMLHEMGHVLGIGTIWGWNDRPCVDILTCDDDGSGYHPYEAGNEASCSATQRYIDAGWPDFLESESPPIEQDHGSGTACGHWDEDPSIKPNTAGAADARRDFKRELMTGFITARSVISEITLGALEDMGFSVDYSKADQLSPSDPSALRQEEAEAEAGHHHHHKHGHVGHHHHDLKMKGCISKSKMVILDDDGNVAKALAAADLRRGFEAEPSAPVSA
ncbi:unnamed protein product [Chrysoparadoxa australica]